MREVTRRQLIQLFAALTTEILPEQARATAGSAVHSPIVGAIRWDAWYDPDGAIGRVGEDSLGPNFFHERMPFFGQALDADHVRIDGNNQTSFDMEIRYARGMGLDYWAYCWYEDGSSLQRGWELHQSSAHANEMKWCMLWQLSHLGGPEGFSKSVSAFVRWMAQVNYQTVEGAPLVYLDWDSDAALAKAWGGDISALVAALDDLRSACRIAKVRAPHIIILNGDPSRAAMIMKQVSGSAISNYIGWIPKDQPAPFSKLVEFNHIFWKKMAATGAPIVPIVMTGWDTRPRKLHPPPWEKSTREQLLATRNTFVVPGTNDEIDSAIRAAITYVEQNPAACSSNLVLIYSWDECDEGGGALMSKSYLASKHHLR